ncbi:HK97 family phage prohead protease [Ancylobacter pratisalsi]|nr:HK97 family phage prohead protease [Ancylobacter pratisalsi]
MDRAARIVRMESRLIVRDVREDMREIEGLATAGVLDRVGDIIEPRGVRVKNPIPLLWQHDHAKPVGTASLMAPTKDGVRFKAKLPHVKNPGALQDRVNEAWDSIKAGIITAVSIGFRPVPGKVEAIANGGMRFMEVEIFELSLVTVPAMPLAEIDMVRGVRVVALDAPGRGRVVKLDKPLRHKNA